jgi:Flp pilus assembly protein TadD
VLSKSFVSWWPRAARPAAVGLLGAALAACGASAPARPEVERPAAVAPASSAPVAAASQQADDERRGSRRDRRAAEEAAAQTEALAAAPVPEPVAQAFERALAAMRTQNWTEAELSLEELVLANPDYPGPYVNLAIIYMRDGRTREARTMLDQALALEPGHAVANNQLGILLRNEGRFADAERAYELALATDPAYGLAHYNLGVLLDVYLRREAEALEHYELYQASLSEPNENVARWIVDLRRRLGGNNSTSRVAQEDGL